MSLFRAEYKDRQGQKKKSGKWYIDFSDHLQIRHKMPAFSDRRQSEALERNIKSLVNCRTSGLEPDTRLNQWLETIPTRLFKKLVSWGLIEGQRAEITKPLAEHIRDYVQNLKAKGFSKDYVVRTKNRLKRIVDGCRFYFFRDITQSAIETYIGKLRNEGFGDTTAGHYLDALKRFFNWAAEDLRIVNNPIVRVKKSARNSKRKGVLTPEQFIGLIKTTFEKNVLVGKITGQERAVLYMLGGTTGIRRNELLNLVWDDINLSGDNAFVRVRASIAKSGKEALQPIPPMVVSLLTALKASITPKSADRVFSSFGRWINTAGLIRDDLTAAQIPLEDREGNEIVFHSLRNSYISWLANSQTPAKIIQKLARHSSFSLTFDTYARTFEGAEQKALNFLPNIGDFVFATSLAKQCVSGRTLPNCSGHKNGQDTQKNAVLTVNQIAPRGFEPLLPG